MVWPWVPKWDPATPIFSWATFNTNFSINTMTPNPNCTVATLTTVSALLLLPDREELNQFITAVNSFHPTLKYTWEISDTYLAFLNKKSFYRRQRFMHYKPADSHGYLLYSTSHPSHVKSSIPDSHFLRLRRL